MKKVICAVLSALLILSLAACGKTAAPVDVQAQADAFVTNCTFEAAMEPVEAEDLGFYFDVPEGTELAGYMADGTSTEMVVCANCKSEADAQALHESFQQYIADQLDQASRYQPEEVARINEGNQTWQLGTNVIMFVCTDTDAAAKLLEGFEG